MSWTFIQNFEPVRKGSIGKFLKGKLIIWIVLFFLRRGFPYDLFNMVKYIL